MSISYLCTFLKIFGASFPLKYKGTKEKKKLDYTRNKKNLANIKEIFTKNSNDQRAKVHYIKYCKILRKVIKAAKKQLGTL